MAYKFKRQIFGFMDLLRFKKMVPKRAKMLEEGSAKPLPKTYRVNETAKILHPGVQEAELVAVRNETGDMKTYTFRLSKKMMFRAGDYVTVGHKIGDSKVARPYAISSSPLTALNDGTVDVTIKKAGFFSDWMYDNAKEGDKFEIGDPSGFFYYDGVRDRKDVVGIAGGSGITPFVCMARALKEGSEDFNLTLFYGARTEKDLAFKAELDSLTGDKFKVVYVLSDEENDKYEHGFVTAEIIKKYAPESYSVFMCGPQAMYDFADKQMEKLGIGGKYVRKESNCVGVRDVKPQEFTITVHIRDGVFKVKADSRETILTAMETPSLVISINPRLHSSSPGVRSILKIIVIRRIRKIAFSPLKINFTGTLDIFITAARNTVATAYPGRVWNRNTDTMKISVPASFVLGSSL